MRPRPLSSERRARAALGGLSGVFLLGAAGLTLRALGFPPPSESFAVPEFPPAAKVESASTRDLDLLGAKRLWRAVPKAAPPAPPPPPKPPAAPLETLLRLSGIMDYGPKAPPEAFLENRATGQTRAYRAGDTIAPLPAVLRGIDKERVLVEYDGKLWSLSDRGAREAASGAADQGGSPP